MAFAASAIGGYIAGRLRTKWVGVHTHEVYFRDTAHGFLAWSVATLATAAFLSSVTGAIISGGIKAGSSVVGGLASTASATAGQMELDGGELEKSVDYFVDSLFRRQPTNGTANQAPATETTNPQTNPNASEPAAMVATTDVPARTDAAEDNAAENTAEVVRIFMRGLREDGDLPQEDVSYVAQLIAQETDLSQTEAEQRVNDAYERVQTGWQEAQATAKEAADKARAASAYASLWFFVSLLIGAFSASLAATFGGRQRDL